MFDPMSWLRFRKPRLRNWSVMVVSAIWLLSVAGPFAGPADASVITTGDVDPGGADTQPDPWSVGGDLKVGDVGHGTLNVEAGGVVSAATGYLGLNSGSTGEATVTGSGSQWSNSGPLRVGYYGDGTLNVESEGVVSSDTGTISNISKGIATATGSGSQWNISSTFENDVKSTECSNSIWAIREV